MADDDAKQHFTFTVYTGTRNRAHTLNRPYDSLRSQTFRDFEWLVVDNESTDGTTGADRQVAGRGGLPDPLYPSRQQGSPRVVQRGRAGGSRRVLPDPRLGRRGGPGSSRAVPRDLERHPGRPAGPLLGGDGPGGRRERRPDRGSFPDRHPRLEHDRDPLPLQGHRREVGLPADGRHAGPPVPDHPRLHRHDVERPDLGRDRAGVPDALRQRVPRHRLLRPAGHPHEGRRETRRTRRARRADGGRCRSSTTISVLPICPGRLLPEGGEVLAQRAVGGRGVRRPRCASSSGRRRSCSGSRPCRWGSPSTPSSGSVSPVSSQVASGGASPAEGRRVAQRMSSRSR